MTALDGFAATFARVEAEQAVALAQRHWGITVANPVRLDTERDDTFRLDVVNSGVGDGEPARVVLKIANPSDAVHDAAVPARALTALERLDAPPVERVIRTGGGRIGVAVGSQRRFARVTTWIAGEGIRARTRSIGDLVAYGATLARLHGAVRTLRLSPAPSPWNLLEFERYATLPDGAPTPSRPLAAIMRTARADTLPRLQRLETVLCHNDFHGDNVLVDPQRPAHVVGVLDFGDLAHTPRIAEFAVAASYVRGYVEPTSDPWEPVAAFLDGYRSLAPVFSDEESALLADLVRLRLAQRILINSTIAATGNAYAARNLDRLNLDLEALAEGAP